MQVKLGFFIFSVFIQSICYGQVVKPHVIDLTAIATSHEKEVYVHEVFDSLSIVHPSNVTEGLIGGMILKTIIYKDFLIVGSINYVQVFDLKGNFIFRTMKGKGPNEVQHLGDFTVDYDKDALLLLDYTGKKVVRVNFNGKYTGTFKVKRGSMNLSYLGGNKTCFFVPFKYYQENGILYDYLYIQDFEGHINFTKKFKREIGESPWVLSQIFNPYKKGSIFKPEYSDTVLFINQEGFHNFKIFDYRGTQMPEKYMSSIELRRKHQHKYIGKASAIFTPTFSFYYIQAKGGYEELFIYNEKNNKIIKAKSTNVVVGGYNSNLKGRGLLIGGSSSKMQVLPLSVSNDGSFLMVCDIEKITEYVLGQDGSNDYYNSLYKSLKELDPANDNPVFLRGYIKN